MTPVNLTGAITALVTPFRDEKVDEQALIGLIDRQIAAGTVGLVPVGTTGEASTLSLEEHKQVVSICVKAAAGRATVIAGAGSNNTSEALELARHGQEVEADALLVVTGYYNKPSQEGLYQHFAALHQVCDLPLVIYNVPARTQSDVSVKTLARLAKLDRIVAVKDATGDLARVALQRQACGAQFIQLSGEDMTAVGFNAMGGSGCISVTGNVTPGHCAKMQTACLAGDYETAVKIQDQLIPLHAALFSDTNPGPVKYALSRLGLCTDEVRLPLVEIDDASKRAVDAALVDLGLVG